MEKISKTFCNKDKKNAFTLTEILVALAVIGVVVAITIPSVVRDTNQAEYKVMLKKAIFNLDQAMSLELATRRKSPSTSTSVQEMLSIIQEKMKVTAPSTGACNNGMTVSDGTPISNTSCSFTTSDGVQYAFLVSTSNYLNRAGVDGMCVPTVAPTVEPGHQQGFGSLCYAITEPSECSGNCIWRNQQCSWINGHIMFPCYLLVDVNGDDKPNLISTDINDLADRYIIMIGGAKGIDVMPVGVAASAINE